MIYDSRFTIYDLWMRFPWSRWIEVACVAVAALLWFANPAGGAESGRWSKGNLHTHSLWSDGDDFPEVIAEWYKTNGYHFLALSDHNIMQKGVKWVSLTNRLREATLEKYF